MSYYKLVLSSGFNIVVEMNLPEHTSPNYMAESRQRASLMLQMNELEGFMHSLEELLELYHLECDGVSSDRRTELRQKFGLQGDLPAVFIEVFEGWTVHNRLNDPD